ncbi:hypothetical protein EVC45_38535 [Paraburkholderia sp. UYCP14C]|uniref:hypothetical protein n=1 Tax=Paraburkholderia sp. UYCP14C TaxID=2511130 RepID=UPI00102160C3|nr:hypothetical protein [Paraburkholderia sp. UYCP14C]RZF24511.1 hypothetical protein EVC45_38535 [Paraburkholderia sp. UYCP14C]
MAKVYLRDDESRSGALEPVHRPFFAQRSVRDDVDEQPRAAVCDQLLQIAALERLIPNFWDHWICIEVEICCQICGA